MAGKVFALVAAAALALSAGQGLARERLIAASAGKPADCHAGAADERALQPLTRDRFQALIAYNQVYGKDVWLNADVAGLVLPEDQYESGPGHSVTLKTDKGDYILFEQPTDAIGAYLFAHRTNWGDTYVFRVDRDLTLKIALIKTTRMRSMRIMPTCQAQRHLDIVMDEWAQIMDMTRSGKRS